MRPIEKRSRTTWCAAVILSIAVFSILGYAQAPPPNYPPSQSYPSPPLPPPAELDRLVSRIALYPDPLLSQVLAAATFPDQIPDAARWADQHHYLTGDALAGAIQADRLPWDPSVQSLLPFPSVLDIMAGDINWTSQLGNAFLASQGAVMDAVQRERRLAYDYGYLRGNAQMVVTPGPYIVIAPANPAFVYVPIYDPLVVYARPRPGFYVAGAIRFGWAFNITAGFRPWGWGYNRFAWDRHTVFINNTVWNRTYVNRNSYVHPYQLPRYEAPRRVEGHELHERSAHEREEYGRGGRGHVEEHERRDERR